MNVKCHSLNCSSALYRQHFYLEYEFSIWWNSEYQSRCSNDTHTHTHTHTQYRSLCIFTDTMYTQSWCIPQCPKPSQGLVYLQGMWVQLTDSHFHTLWELDITSSLSLTHTHTHTHYEYSHAEYSHRYSGSTQPYLRTANTHSHAHTLHAPIYWHWLW